MLSTNFHVIHKLSNLSSTFTSRSIISHKQGPSTDLCDISLVTSFNHKDIFCHYPLPPISKPNLDLISQLMLDPMYRKHLDYLPCKTLSNVLPKSKWTSSTTLPSLILLTSSNAQSTEWIFPAQSHSDFPWLASLSKCTQILPLKIFSNNLPTTDTRPVFPGISMLPFLNTGKH